MKKAVFLLIILNLGMSSAWSQDMVLTLEQSVQIALEKNPEIRMSEKEVKKASAGIWEAYTAILPTVDASVNLSQAWSIQENTIPNFMKSMLTPEPGVLPPEVEAIFSEYTTAMPDYVKLSFALKNTLMYGATLNQPLFLGGAGIAGIQMAYSARNSAKYDLESRRQNMIYQTTNAFYSCLLARELVQVQEEALKQAEANMDIVHKKYEVGSASGFEKMRAEVEVANLKPEVIAARNNYQAALTGLRTILGLPKDNKIDVEGSLSFEADDMSSMTLEDLQAKALSTRPEIFNLQAQKSMADKNVCLAVSEFMPKLFFSADYSYLAMKNDLVFSRHDFSKGFTGALSLQIPLFHGFRSHKQVQRAKLDVKIVQDSEQLMRDGIAAEAEIAYNKFRESREKYQASRESIDLAEEALRLANLMYEEGASTQLDVLGSQLALTQARLNHASALYEYQMSRYELRRVTGTLHGVF